MRVICSYCRTVITRGGGPSDDAVSHGICVSCITLSDPQLDAMAEMWASLRDWARLDGLIPCGPITIQGRFIPRAP